MARQRTLGLIADAARSPAIAAVVSRVWSSRLQLGEDIIRRAGVRGELRDDLPPTSILAAFTSPLYMHLLTTEERIADGFLDAVVEVGLHGAGTRKRVRKTQ